MKLPKFLSHLEISYLQSQNIWIMLGHGLKFVIHKMWGHHWLPWICFNTQWRIRFLFNNASPWGGGEDFFRDPPESSLTQCIFCLWTSLYFSQELSWRKCFTSRVNRGLNSIKTVPASRSKTFTTKQCYLFPSIFISLKGIVINF